MNLTRVMGIWVPVAGERIYTHGEIGHGDERESVISG